MNQTRLDVTKLTAQRARMVDQQLRGRGIRDVRVLAAMRALPRHLFVPEEHMQEAYLDCALPIGFGQTISQPYMVALMLEALELGGQERVLDVGTGSGYQAALLGLLVREVFSVEIVPDLATRARNTIASLGFEHVSVVLGNGSIGLPQAAPYDAIVVAAGAPEVPQSLLDQLADGGKLVIPAGSLGMQDLLRVTKHAGSAHTESITPCAFVPLVGQQGWSDLEGARQPGVRGR